MLKIELKEFSATRGENSLCFKGMTALHLAAAEGFTECVDFLLTQGAHVNKNDINGNICIIII